MIVAGYDRRGHNPAARGNFSKLSHRSESSVGNGDLHNAERRRFQRVRLEGSVRVYSDRAAWEAALIDLSLKGVLIERPVDWDGSAGRTYRLDLRVNGSLVISMGVTAARIVPDGIAFEWKRIDLDSFAKLKRTLELNLGDSDLLNRELSALG